MTHGNEPGTCVAENNVARLRYLDIERISAKLVASIALAKPSAIVKITRSEMLKDGCGRVEEKRSKRRSHVLRTGAGS